VKGDVHAVILARDAGVTAFWAANLEQVLWHGWVVRPVGTVQDGNTADVTNLWEGIMFRSKTKEEQLTEQLQEDTESLASTASALAEQLRGRVVPAMGHASDNARDWARPRYEHGITVAAPKLESAVNALAPKVDTARDKIVEDLLPRIAEAISAWAAASASAKDEMVSRGQGAAAVITGDAVAAPKRSMMGRMRVVMMAFALFGAIAAGVTTFMKRSAPKDDPWTTPLGDSNFSSQNGRHAAPSLVEETTATTRTESEILDAPINDAATSTPTSSVSEPELVTGVTGDVTVTPADLASDGPNKNGHQSS
jgi:hypothetical protein